MEDCDGPADLSEARRASGRLGGRPRKPTQAEAPAAALEELVPAAIKSLRAHVGDGDPGDWRAALRVFELSYGKPAETVEVELDQVDPLRIGEMTREERGVLVARLLKQHPHLAELMPERLRKARDSPLPLKRDLRAGTPRAGLGASGGL